MISLLEAPLMPHETGEDTGQHVIQRSRGFIDADHAAYGLKGQNGPREFQVQPLLHKWYMQQAGGYQNIEGAIAPFK